MQVGPVCTPCGWLLKVQISQYDTSECGFEIMLSLSEISFLAGQIFNFSMNTKQSLKCIIQIAFKLYFLRTSRFICNYVCVIIM